MNLQY